MSQIFITYALDWKGPEVQNFHLTEDAAKDEANGNQYLFVERFDFPGDPSIDREATLDYIQGLLWSRFADGFDDE